MRLLLISIPIILFWTAAGVEAAGVAPALAASTAKPVKAAATDRTKLLVIEASTLGNNELGQLKGGQLNEILFDISSIIQLTRPYDTHHDVFVSPGGHSTDGAAVFQVTVSTL